MFVYQAVYYTRYVDMCRAVYVKLRFCKLWSEQALIAAAAAAAAAAAGFELVSLEPIPAPT
jgi:hypothetical protein